MRHLQDLSLHRASIHSSTSRSISDTQQLHRDHTSISIRDSQSVHQVEIEPSTKTMTNPSDEVVEDFLLSCRYGELEEVEAFTTKYGDEAVASARDERGNTALHMCCGNGHTDVLQYLITHLPPTLFQQTNEAGSPPLHWAILNNHVSVVKILSELEESLGGGLPLLHQEDRSGKDAFAQAIFAGEGKEEVAGWIEGFLFKAEGGDDIELPESTDAAERADGETGSDEADPSGVEVVANGDEGAKTEAITELEEKASRVQI